MIRTPTGKFLMTPRKTIEHFEESRKFEFKNQKILEQLHLIQTFPKRITVD